MAMGRREREAITVATAALILLAAAGLRLYALSTTPVGLHYDEAANGILAAEIAAGKKLPVFISSYTGKEVLFFYWAALWMRLVGVTPLALRIAGASVGILTVAANVWAVRELLGGGDDGRWIALFSGAFLATSFWHVLLSRYGFRAVSQPLLQALTVAALWRGWRTSSRRWMALAGLFCGLTAYTYLAARAFPIPLAAAWVAFCLEGRRDAVGGRSRRASPTDWGVFLALFGGAASLALAPLAHYWWSHPGSFWVRTRQVAAAGWREAWEGMLACARMFFIQGDPYIRFNLPGRPLFDAWTAGLACLGLVAVAGGEVGRRMKWTRRVFLLVYLPVMLLPSALATGEITPSNLRAVGLLPFLYLFPAAGLWTLVEFAVRRWPRWRHWWLPFALCLVVMVASGGQTATGYFDRWGRSAALYYAADGDMADAVIFQNKNKPEGMPSYIASRHYRHPTAAFLASDYQAIRWLTGGETLVFPPQSAGEVLLLVPRSAADALPWMESLLVGSGATLEIAPPGPDGRPAFHAYRLTAAALPTPTHPLTANFGYVARLLGYDVIGTARSGEQATAVVWWQVMNRPDAGDYGPLVNLSDRWGFVWGESGPFHYPAEQWTPGEVVADRLTVPIATGAPPGAYALRFGFYAASADARLPVLDERGGYAGTYVSLPISLTRPHQAVNPAALDTPRPIDGHLTGVTLIGAHLHTPERRPGEPLYLTLFWQAQAGPRSDMAITLTLGAVTLYHGDPVHGTYPTSRWADGEVVADRYDPRLPREMSTGTLPLRLHADGQVFDLGEVAVLPIERRFELPSPDHPLQVSLGERVRLLGYDLDPDADSMVTGGMFRLTLYWQAQREMETRYTVFVHLVAPDGSIVAQRDAFPVHGSYPTDLWVASEVVADEYEVSFPPQAPPGEYLLLVGMYVAETGERLPVSGPSAAEGDSAILLRVISLMATGEGRE